MNSKMITEQEMKDCHNNGDFFDWCKKTKRNCIVGSSLCKGCDAHWNSENEDSQNEMPILQETVIQCIRRNESVIFIESHDQCNHELLMKLAEDAGYKVWTVDESEEFKPDFGKYALDSKEFREPSRKKCFYHLTLRWNNNLADRDNLDIWFVTFLRHSLQELISEADSKADGLDIPVNIVVDNMALLSLSTEDLDGLIAGMQRRQRWGLKIIAQL